MGMIVKADKYFYAEQLTKLCDEKKICINQLASMSGHPASTITQIANGRSKNPSISTMLDIARVLGVDVNELVKEIAE